MFLCYRLFKVTIRQDAQSVFADDVIFENSLGPINFNKDSVYSGFLEGKTNIENVSYLSILYIYNVWATCMSTNLIDLLLTFLDSPSSSVHGIVTEEGHFDGHISTPTDHFYIEPAKR